MFNILNQTIDLLLPRFCIACKLKLLHNENWLCEKCFNSMAIADSKFIEDFYNEKFKYDTNVNFLFSCFKFYKEGAFQKIIHQLKYNGKHRIGSFLGEILGNRLKEITNINEYDLILSVPIHMVKKIDRGYNQTEYIAKSISKIINIPYYNNIVERKVYKESQTTHNKSERLANIKGVFNIKNPKFIRSKNIIIVDDIITTGATIIEISDLCKTSGANNIAAISAGLTVL